MSELTEQKESAEQELAGAVKCLKEQKKQLNGDAEKLK